MLLSEMYLPHWAGSPGPSLETGRIPGYVSLHLERGKGPQVFGILPLSFWLLTSFLIMIPKALVTSSWPPRDSSQEGPSSKCSGTLTVLQTGH